MDSKFIGLPIASIQASKRIAVIEELIIDPHKLHVIAFYVSGDNLDGEHVLFVSDITQLSPQGIVIDHDDLLMKDDDDLVRLQEITKMNFHLIDKPVETENGRKVGKVSRFALEATGYIIMQLNVGQPMTLNLGKAEVVIHRNQIVNVTDKKVIVKDASVKVGAKFGFKGLLFGKQQASEVEAKSSRANKN